MSASKADMQAPWMWGSLGREEAVRKLKGQPAGTFLVRPGSKPRTWSLSLVKGGAVVHVRIISKAGGFCFSNADAPLPSLSAMVAKRMAMRERSDVVLTRALANPARGRGDVRIVYMRLRSRRHATPTRDARAVRCTTVPPRFLRRSPGLGCRGGRAHCVEQIAKYRP